MTVEQTHKAPMAKDILRVALDKQATRAYFNMVERLRDKNDHIKVQASAFVSFLISDYLATYFEKDIPVLVAEFFDAKAYHAAQIAKSQGLADFESVMTETLATTKKIKARARRKVALDRAFKTTTDAEDLP